MTVIRSIIAVLGGLSAGVLLDRWVVFPAILRGSAYLPSGSFAAHQAIYLALLLLLEVGSATLCTGGIIGLVAPARPGWHAVAAGLIGGMGGVVLGPQGSVTTFWRVFAFAVQTVALIVIARGVAKWRVGRRRISVATA